MALKIPPALPAQAGTVKGKLAPVKGGEIAALFAKKLQNAVAQDPLLTSLLAGAVQVAPVQVDASGTVVLRQAQHDSVTPHDSAKAPVVRQAHPVVRQAHHDELGTKGAPGTSTVTASPVPFGDASRSQSDPATKQTKDPPPKIAASPPKAESPPPQPQQQNAGQTIEFSGKILDAVTAKDIPAPQPAPQNDVQDLLARMISRAVNADRQRQNPVSASSQNPASSTSVTTGVTNAATAAFQHAIVTAAAAAGQQQGSPQQSPHQQSSAQNQPQKSTPQISNGAQTAGPVIAQSPTAVQTAFTQPIALTYSTVDPHAIVEQIVKGIMVRTDGSQTQVRLRLQPEHLGDVSLKLTVDGNTIAANVVAQNADVRDVLLANTQQLARSLADAGLALGNFSVDVSGGNAGFTEQHSQSQHAPLKAAALGSFAGGEDESMWADAPAQASNGTAQSLVLNHLV